MDGGTYASVTREPCRCRTMEQLAGGRGSLVVFDDLTGEYQLRGRAAQGGEQSITLYHCCFCGGVLPRTRRDELFHRIDPAEEARLLGLCSGLDTAAAAVARLGPPDQDLAHGVIAGLPERAGAGPSRRYHRRLVYERLSERVDVHLTEDGEGRLHLALQGKYKGR